jgi:hypothetical protein
MVNTLTKFGVPVNGARVGMLQPKIKHRFRVRVINFGPIAGGLELTEQVMNVNRPNVSMTGQAVHSYNSIMHYAGKAEWQTLTLKVRDDITNTVSKLVGHQIQKQMNFFEQTSAAAGINYKFQMIIEMLDGGNEVAFETWTLEGCFIENLNYEDLDYGSSDAVSIDMTIRYDNATLADGLFTTAPQFTAGTALG